MLISSDGIKFNIYSTNQVKFNTEGIRVIQAAFEL